MIVWLFKPPIKPFKYDYKSKRRQGFPLASFQRTKQSIAKTCRGYSDIITTTIVPQTKCPNNLEHVLTGSRVSQEYYVNENLTNQIETSKNL